MVWRVCLFQMYSWNFEIFLGLLFGTYVACMEFIIYFSTSNRYWASYQHTNFSICLCHCLICYFFDNALTLDRFKTMDYMGLHEVEKFSWKTRELGKFYLRMFEVGPFKLVKTFPRAKLSNFDFRTSRNFFQLQFPTRCKPIYSVKIFKKP